jgi:SprB repeat
MLPSLQYYQSPTYRLSVMDVNVTRVNNVQTATVTGGVAPYQYRWNDNSTAPTSPTA